MLLTTNGMERRLYTRITMGFLSDKHQGLVRHASLRSRSSSRSSQDAGDAFNGAFATCLIEGRDPTFGAAFACAAAAISVTRRGAQASMPTRQEVMRLLAEQSPEFLKAQPFQKTESRI